MKTIRILILEDDLETLAGLLQCLNSLEIEHEGQDIAPTVISEYTMVEQLLNRVEKNVFSAILLDRDCKAGGNFHCLDFNIYPVDRIIGISSTPPYNEELKQKGVKRLVHKDYQNLDKFIKEVKAQIEDLVFKA